MRTAPAGTKIDGGTFTIPEALGDKVFHPYSDFLLHDVGTGDGIGIAVAEHFGAQAGYMPRAAVDQTANRLRTPPLWGVRLRTRLMRDGANVTFFDAIRRHAGEARGEARRERFIPTSVLGNDRYRARVSARPVGRAWSRARNTRVDDAGQ